MWCVRTSEELCTIKPKARFGLVSCFQQGVAESDLQQLVHRDKNRIVFHNWDISVLTKKICLKRIPLKVLHKLFTSMLLFSVYSPEVCPALASELGMLPNVAASAS